jgi:hypothetical protein
MRLKVLFYRVYPHDSQCYCDDGYGGIQKRQQAKLEKTDYHKEDPIHMFLTQGSKMGIDGRILIFIHFGFLPA